MTKFRRVARNEYPSTDPTRRGKIDVNYVYMDEAFQTVNIRVPLEEDTAERVRELLRERARAVERGGALEIEV